MDKIFFTTVIWIFLTILFLYATIKAKTEKAYYLTYTTLCLTSFVLGLIGNIYKNSDFIILSFSLFIGVFCMLIALQTIFRIKKCKAEVDATVLYIAGSAGHKVTPHLKFKYQEKEYNTSSFVSLSLRKCQKLFPTGSKCKAYINPESPDICTVSLKIPSYIIAVFFISLFFLIVSVLVIIY